MGLSLEITDNYYPDRFGRKASFTLGAAFFIVGSFFCTFSPWYSLFLAGRFALGAASSGLFYPAFTMSKSLPNYNFNFRSY